MKIELSVLAPLDSAFRHIKEQKNFEYFKVCANSSSDVQTSCKSSDMMTQRLRYFSTLTVHCKVILRASCVA